MTDNRDIAALRERLRACRIHHFETEQGMCFLLPTELMLELDAALAERGQDQSDAESGKRPMTGREPDPHSSAASAPASASDPQSSLDSSLALASGPSQEGARRASSDDPT